jgi:hypothetical protein
MKIIFGIKILCSTSFISLCQNSNSSFLGCWKVNYFANGLENTSAFPESIKMVYHFFENGTYTYSVSENDVKNEQKGKYQISSNSLLLQVDDVKMNCLIFRITSQEIVFKTSVEGEELFFIMNKINCK